jgi:hypothetical protein
VGSDESGESLSEPSLHALTPRTVNNTEAPTPKMTWPRLRLVLRDFIFHTLHDPWMGRSSARRHRPAIHDGGLVSQWAREEREMGRLVMQITLFEASQTLRTDIRIVNRIDGCPVV